MLYKGADLVRDIEWVIFDEVHYINDPERGVVWEETIIMLPEHVNIILLSASVPNVNEFADWVGRTKRKKVFVVATAKRPVPLEHHLYTCRERIKILDDSGTFLADSFFATKKMFQEKTKGQRISDKTIQSEWVHLVKELEKESQLPVVCFIFSRKKVDECADNMRTLDLTTGVEKSQIQVFVNQCVSRLSPCDRQLPQVMRVKEMLLRGFGVHHAGLLPIIKEIVEMLFSQSLVKVLFATETFAMGVNMPARTVIFQKPRKHDGKDFRDLNPSEYQQMSGRAGRRGLDKKGMVIILTLDYFFEDHMDLKKMLTGSPQRLESKFRLTYAMLVNLLRVEDFRVEDILRRSFSEASIQKLVPQQSELRKLAKEKFEKLGKLTCIYDEFPAIEEYYETYLASEEHFSKFRESFLESPGAKTQLSAGRVLLVQDPVFGRCLGLLIRFFSTDKNIRMFLMSNDGNQSQLFGYSFYNNADTPIKKQPPLQKPEKIHREGEYGNTKWKIVELNVLRLRKVCKDKLTIDVQQLENGDNGVVSVAINSLNKLTQTKSGTLTVLDDIKDFKISTIDAVEAFSSFQELEQELKKSKCHNCPQLEQQFNLAADRHALKKKLQQLSHTLSDENVMLLPEFQKRVRVLETLNYIDSNRTVLLKGRVMCEINSLDELLASELIFHNILTDLEPQEILAILSTMICPDKDDNRPTLTPVVQKTFDIVKDMAYKLGELQYEHGLDVDPQEYANKLNMALMEVVYEWAMGTAFADIMNLTLIPEGSIVRAITRLDVGCNEVKNCARIIGNTSLFHKMEIASQKIKRDIVFAASLYVQ
eukprot:c20807_g1_i1.p1 GENE.c20807_g1_i1~~c20807_g1_i1.p1  ORF type:complete len:819 (+),score=295.46 c20807_g1_i1:60-2516(+)